MHHCRLNSIRTSGQPPLKADAGRAKITRYGLRTTHISYGTNTLEKGPWVSRVRTTGSLPATSNVSSNRKQLSLRRAKLKLPRRRPQRQWRTRLRTINRRRRRRDRPMLRLRRETRYRQKRRRSLHPLHRRMRPT